MYTVMVTGGIGSGKSTLVDILKSLGAQSLDLDAINRMLISSNEQMIAEIAERFGEDVLDDEGSIIPAKLAEKAFASEQDTKDLNTISFPYIIQKATDHILHTSCTDTTNAHVMVIEVPLLTEVPDFAKLADEIITVSSPLEVRLARCIDRGMDATDALRRMRMQPDDVTREAIADTVCNNTQTHEELESWAREWWHNRFHR